MNQTTQPTEADLAKLEAELDPEMQFRPLLPAAAWIVAGLLMALSLFHYYTAGFGLLRETTHRGIHMAFVLGLIFLVFSARRSGNAEAPTTGPLKPLGIPLQDWLLAAAAAVTSLYVPWIFEDLAFRVGNPMPIDVIMGTLLVVVLLEATRRSVGLALPLIAVFLMIYALYGQSFRASSSIPETPGKAWSTTSISRARASSASRSAWLRPTSSTTFCSACWRRGSGSADSSSTSPRPPSAASSAAPPRSRSSAPASSA